MYKNILFWAFLLCIVTGVPFRSSAQDDSATGKVYFIRSSDVGYNTAPVRNSLGYRPGGVLPALIDGVVKQANDYCNVFIDSSYLCKLDQFKYFTYNIQPGMHVFSLQDHNKDFKGDYPKILVDIEPGKTYYIQMCFDRDLYGKEQYCTLLSEKRANIILLRLHEDKSCCKVGKNKRN